VLFVKQVGKQFYVMVHPHIVRNIRIDGRILAEEHVTGSTLFIGTYLAVVGVATLVVAILGTPLLEAFSGTVACMGNIGPGMGSIGSMANYDGLSDGAKFVLSAVMLIGRVEIYGVLLLLTPGFWLER
jgi:trk system potassium uptake protein TrkH